MPGNRQNDKNFNQQGDNSQQPQAPNNQQGDNSQQPQAPNNQQGDNSQQSQAPNNQQGDNSQQPQAPSNQQDSDNSKQSSSDKNSSKEDTSATNTTLALVDLSADSVDKTSADTQNDAQQTLPANNFRHGAFKGLSAMCYMFAALQIAIILAIIIYLIISKFNKISFNELLLNMRKKQ